MTHDEIIEVAKLMQAVDEDPHNAGKFQSLEAGMDRAKGDDAILVMLAYKLLTGQGYAISGDNPQTINKCQTLARAMGATATVSLERPWYSPPDAPPQQVLRCMPSPDCEIAEILVTS